MLPRLSISIPLVATLALAACQRATPPPPPAVVEVPPNLAPLGTAPDWADLQTYTGTITQAEFTRLLHTVYAFPEAAATTLTLSEEMLRIRQQTHVPLTDTAPTADLRWGTQPNHASRYWRTRGEIPISPDPTRPLLGVRIALDPGHIGGSWAQLEERSFQPVSGPPICEGTHTLLTAQILQPMLEALGATVMLVRTSTEPVTTERPENFTAQARSELVRQGLDPDHPPDTQPIHTVRWQAEKLFYRTAEIRARARLVNTTLRPDVVVCLHFNAGGTSWGAPGQPHFSTENHLHLLLNGGFHLDELTLDDQRHEMLSRLLSGVHEEELGLAISVAQGLATSTGLPPFTYHGGALPVAGQPYLWMRNLLANRLYACPVVYCEPYVMNNATVAARIQAGDGEGSIFREYAQGVADGLRAYYAGRNER